MNSADYSALEGLQIADPETYVWVKGRVALMSPPPSQETLALLVEETIWGLSLEAGLGRAVAEGGLLLISNGAGQRLTTFVEMVHQAAGTGVTLGRLTATFAAPVLAGGADLLDKFQQALSVMLKKGTYTLTAPLEVMSELLAAGEEPSAASYLDLLAATFEQQISYNQSLRLVYLLPKAVRSFAPGRRKTQIEQLNKLTRHDLQLVEPFIEGMEKGLALLDGKSLDQFIQMALTRYARMPEAGLKFLNLTSKVGQEACAALQRAVPLAQVKGRLDRYLSARVGRPLVIGALSELSLPDAPRQWVCSDGRCIYLPDEVDQFENQDDNVFLYKSLVRLEAGYFEYGTFDFDLERAADQFPEVAGWIKELPVEDSRQMRCDGERFVDCFFPRALADDLFTIYEQARVGLHLKHGYPGLTDQVMPLMRSQIRSRHRNESGHLLWPLFARLVLDLDQPVSENPQAASMQRRLIDLFYENIGMDCAVEVSCRLVCMAFDHLRDTLGRRLNRYTPMRFPFERRIRWDLVSNADAAREESVLRIKARLRDKGMRVYRSDLRNRLKDRQGRLSADDITELVLARDPNAVRTGFSTEDMPLDLEELLRDSGVGHYVAGDARDAATRYPEWDFRLQDYLHDHTYIHEIEIPARGIGRFYDQTLKRYGGLVTRMRRAFELLKPEGLTILRQWPEGDAFDYRALIDFAIDRKAGRIPSDRMFIKRLKQERDVAVLLLADLSRSTANPVAGGHASVLDVAKEALVLFCEALQVVGDDYAIAGFSGTGRHAVDFYGIKSFREPLSDAVRERISVLSPQRSTRMGAAVRHATSLLAKAESRVRLIIVVSDGFPNDLGYKADYAIADTRRAVQEARARNFHVKAITVNIGSDPRLDDLYGRVHHHVIGDVRELPGKLLRLYGTLTRY